MSPEGQNCPQVRITALAPWGVSSERKMMEQREDVTLWAGLSFGRKEPGDGAGASQPSQPPGLCMLWSSCSCSVGPDLSAWISPTSPFGRNVRLVKLWNLPEVMFVKTFSY